MRVVRSKTYLASKKHSVFTGTPEEFMFVNALTVKVESRLAKKIPPKVEGVSFQPMNAYVDPGSV